MELIIEQLKVIAAGETERGQRVINNLIMRIEFFDLHSAEDKLKSCYAEAELWGVVRV